MRTALTGASGRIGKSVARALAKAGHHVLRIARNPLALDDLSGSTDIQGDLRDPARWIAQIADCDALIHCGCDWSGDMAASDAKLLDALIETRFEGRVLYTGGIWSFGDKCKSIQEDRPLKPATDFSWMIDGWRKLQGAGLDVVLVHPALVWTSVAAPHPAFGLEGRPLPGPGTQTWPMVHADDLGEGYRLALEHGKTGRSYLFASGHTRVRDLAEAMLPGADLVFSPTDPNDPWCWDQRVSSSRALAELGWKPQYADAVKTLGNSAKP